MSVNITKKEPAQKTSTFFKVVIISSVLIPIVLVGTLWLLFASLFRCDNEIRAQIDSPDHQFKAVVFSRNCGATTSFNTQLSIIPYKDALPNDEGNVFIEDQGAAKSLNIKVSWLGPQKLMISYYPKAQVFFKNNSLDVRTGIFTMTHITIIYDYIPDT